MIELTLQEVAAGTGGRLAGGAAAGQRVTGSVEFDSRSVTAGGLFVALPGERADGHDFAGKAIDSGAVAVIAAREVGVASIQVEDPLAALAALARTVVGRLPDLVIVGVTGSVGKTTTKDLLAELLRPLGPTVAPTGSFNTEVGYPHTVLRSTVDTRYLVLEQGARGIGHIAALCRIARPRIGVVLGVGTAHLGEFGSREAIAQAKGELVEALPPAADGGVAVLMADDPMVAAMVGRTAARVVTAGTGADRDVRAVDVALGADGRASFGLRAGARQTETALQLVGGHQVGNALAAAAVALELGLPLQQVGAGLRQAAPASRWRMEVHRRGDGVTIVNDAYNANPESMRAALSTLRQMAGGGRTVAVLGEMGELGAAGPREHAALGRAVARAGIDRLVAVGPVGSGAEIVHRSAREAGMEGGRAVLVADVAPAAAIAGADLRPGDVVLVKASRVVGLERLAERLLADSHGDGIAVPESGG